MNVNFGTIRTRCQNLVDENTQSKSNGSFESTETGCRGGTFLSPYRVTEIAYGEQHHSQNGTPKIEIMTGTSRHPPIH